jgi:hypothetical protein
MLNFKQTINPITAHDSYSAWREADHDDLVLSVAMACWFGEREPKLVPICMPNLESGWVSRWRGLAGGMQWRGH